MDLKSYQAGYDAFTQGKKLTDRPNNWLDVGTNWNDWQTGWLDALGDVVRTWQKVTPK